MTNRCMLLVLKMILNYSGQQPTANDIAVRLQYHIGKS